MSRRLLQLVMPVTPGRRMFRIHDPAVDPDAPGGPLPPVGALISTNREQVWVGSLQQDIDVRVVLEEWDSAPPPCGDAWDEEAKGSVYLRGQLTLEMGGAGTAVRGLRLTGGVGDYAVRVYASNRAEVTQRYAELFDRHRNPLSDDFQQEKRALEGLERYLLQLWRESLERRLFQEPEVLARAWSGCVACALPLPLRTAVVDLPTVLALPLAVVRLAAVALAPVELAVLARALPLALIVTPLLLTRPPVSVAEICVWLTGGAPGGEAGVRVACPRNGIIA